MSIQETLVKCNAFVIQKENEYGQGLIREYDETVESGTEFELDELLTKMTKEARRLDKKDKWDEEEVRIALIVKRRGIM